MDRRRVGIVIPALNEAATIGAVVAAVSMYGIPIVVDDGSDDGTAERAEASQAVVVRHAANRGYDQALNSGFAMAAALDCVYVLTIDADGQHDPTRIEGFLSALDRGADLVVGVRDQRQRFAESVFGRVARARWGVRDPLCGMKAYRMHVWEARGWFDSYGSVGTELALFAAGRGFRIVECDVPTRARRDRPRFGSSLRANVRIFRALFLGLRRLPARSAPAESVSR